MTMRAMILHEQAPVETAPLRLEDVDIPEPGTGEIRIRVEACGLCHTDLHTVEGDFELRKKPVIPGHQIAGLVEALGEGVTRFEIGDRSGIAWLHETCGKCRFCLSRRENLCLKGRFTGWDVDGGYAEYTIVNEDWAYPIPDGIGAVDAAPLLCGGIVGYRALKHTDPSPGRRIGLFGFGNSAHMTIQVAHHLGCEVSVFTRNPDHQRHAEELGAIWVGSVPDEPPFPLDAAIIFAPAGTLVPPALRMLDRGGILVLGGIFMTPVPEMEYLPHLWDEKIIRSVANATRGDGQELLHYASEIPIITETMQFPLEDANEALLKMKMSEITGDAVLVV
ncbi:zinc-dependent alcohol dehydrogenase family protein [Candidatus Zixiibacteriota bacterium]